MNITIKLNGILFYEINTSLVIVFRKEKVFVQLESLEKNIFCGHIVKYLSFVLLNFSFYKIIECLLFRVYFNVM